MSPAAKDHAARAKARGVVRAAAVPMTAATPTTDYDAYGTTGIKYLKSLGNTTSFNMAQLSGSGTSGGFMVGGTGG